jgi:hypothetical protein
MWLSPAAFPAGQMVEVDDVTAWRIRPEIELERPRYDPAQSNYEYLQGFAHREALRRLLRVP